jgi:hypothetical protein
MAPPRIAADGRCFRRSSSGFRGGVICEAIGRVVGTLFVTFVVMLLVGGVYYLVRRPRVTFWGRSSGGGSS